MSVSALHIIKVGLVKAHDALAVASKWMCTVHQVQRRTVTDKKLIKSYLLRQKFSVNYDCTVNTHQQLWMRYSVTKYFLKIFIN